MTRVIRSNVPYLTGLFLSVSMVGVWLVGLITIWRGLWELIL